MSKATPLDIVVTRWGARFMGRRFPCSIGRGGITHNKREGDWATPAGAHRIVGALWRPDRLARPCDWAVPIHPSDLWSDDPKDQDYNHMVQVPYPHSHEKLRRADRLYDMVLVTDWNWPVAEPGKGSAIFIHCWRRPRRFTAGCVAFDPSHLGWMLRHIRYETRLIVRA